MLVSEINKAELIQKRKKEYVNVDRRRMCAGMRGEFPVRELAPRISTRNEHRLRTCARAATRENPSSTTKIKDENKPTFEQKIYKYAYN